MREDPLNIIKFIILNVCLNLSKLLKVNLKIFTNSGKIFIVKNYSKNSLKFH